MFMRFVLSSNKLGVGTNFPFELCFHSVPLNIYEEKRGRKNDINPLSLKSLNTSWARSSQICQGMLHGTPFSAEEALTRA